jgi:uncharacterized protein YukE
MSSSQIHNDPVRLREFATGLNRFASISDEHLDRLRSAISHLGQSWQDQEFDRFVEAFVQAQFGLKNFIDEIHKVTPVLEEDASKLEDYQRFGMTS